MKIKQHIPNAITALNLLSGCMALLFIFERDLVTASILVFAAAGFDFLDGLVARLLKVNSDIGKQLDSLADVISFGLVPGMMMFIYMNDQVPEFHFLAEFPLLQYVPFLMIVFSAIRLAKFNIDTRQSDSFIGVPTPANALVIISFPLILKYGSFLTELVTHPYFILAYSLLMSYLMVAELPLFALKFKNLKWQDNKIRFIFLLLSLILLIVLRFEAIPFIVFLYILLSIINNQLKST